MNELSGKCVNFVLAVEMGRGMGFVKHPIKIVANFNERTLESDLVNPSDYHIFNTELVWEIEKTILKKLRTINAPLRIEIQLVDNKKQCTRIGFIILSPRCAIIVQSNSSLEVPFKWQKLLGVAAENKVTHPELYLSLTIRDLGALVNVQTPILIELTTEDEDSEASDVESTEHEDELISIQYLEDGFIQIGNSASCEKYTLSILMQVAYNLDLLLPEASVFNQTKDKYYITFKVFNITIKSKPFCRDLHANIPLNERIVMRILSNYDTLRAYLSNHCQIIVCFYCGHNKLGCTSLGVNSLLKYITFAEFSITNCTTCEEECVFKDPSTNDVPIAINNRKPYIEVETTLKKMEDLTNLLVTDLEEIPSHDCIHAKEEMYPHVSNDNACGDKAEDLKANDEIKVPTVTAAGDQNVLAIIENGTSNHSVINVPFKNEEVEIESAKESVTGPVSETEESMTSAVLDTYNIKRIEDINKNITLYQQYCLDVIIETITLKKKLKSANIGVKFKHPKASSTITVRLEIENHIGEDIMLENTRCKMFFITTEDHIRKLVYTWPPKLFIVDKNDQDLIQELDIYTAMFLSKKKIECSYITEGKSVRTYEPLVTVSVVMFLQQYGLSALPQQTECDLLPPILDENIEIKNLRELQEWEKTEKVQFATDLNILQKRRLLRIKEEWKKKETQLEEKLTKNINKCENLSQELQEAVNSLRTKAAFANLDNSKNAKAFETINYLKLTNDNLKNTIDDQRQDIDYIKKTALTQQQTASLLQQLRIIEEKLGETEKAKTYFKDQWQKAVKEIHDLRSEDQKQIQEIIQNQKNELSKIDMESFDSNVNETTSFEYQSEDSSIPLAGVSWNSSNFDKNKHSATSISFPLGKDV